MNGFFTNKKGIMLPTIKTFLILFVTTVILVTFILILNEYSKLSIDENKINQQLVINKMFNGGCFSDEFGVIEKEKFTKTNLDDCFNGLLSNSQDLEVRDVESKIKSNILFKVGMKTYDGHKVFSDLDDFFYVGDKEKFDELYKFNSLDSNVLISSLEYPIIYLDENGIQKDVILVLKIITY